MKRQPGAMRKLIEFEYRFRVRPLVLLSLSVALSIPSCPFAQDSPPVKIPAPDISQIAKVDWMTLLSDPATRRLVASLIFDELPANIKLKVNEDQIDEALGVVVNEVRSIQGGIGNDEKLMQVVRRLGERLWKEEADKIEKLVHEAAKKVEEFIEVEDGKYVVNFERAGSLRVLYQEKRFRGPSTMIDPPSNIRHGHILVSGRHIRLSLDGKRFDGRGDLILKDRYGQFTADALRFNEKEGLLISDKLDLKLPSLKVTAGYVSTNTRDVDMKDLHLRSTVAGVPVLTMSAATLATEGDWGTATDFKINILGIRAYGRNYWKFPVTRLDNDDPMPSLAERLKKLGEVATYLRPPVIDLFGRAPAVSYANTLTFGNRQQFDVGLRAQKGQFFASHGRFTWNLLRDPGSNPNILTARRLISDFAGGYVQNPGVRSMENYINSYRRPRMTGVVDFAFNQRVELRGVEDIESTPFGVGVEFGGPINRFGGVGQIRYETAKVVGRKSENRFVALGTLGLFQATIARGLEFNSRIDGAAFKPQGKGYAWIRPVASLQARILPQLYISGSYVNGSEFGPAFRLGDRYLAGPEYHARLDLNFGATQISYSNRYSARQKSWYRSQLYVAQDIDAFQLYVLSDQSLGRFSFGLQLRLEEILAGLKGRRYTGVAFDPPVAKKL